MPALSLYPSGQCCSWTDWIFEFDSCFVVKDYLELYVEVAFDISPADITGIIFNIQRYSVQDGPGIRTTVSSKAVP